MILVIQSAFFYSIQASHSIKINTPSDPTRETDHVDHDLYYQVIVNRISLRNHTKIFLKGFFKTSMIIEIIYGPQTDFVNKQNIYF